MHLVTNNPHYWQNNAEEAWSIASELNDAHCKAVMVRIAQGCERMIAWAEKDSHGER
jgi:quercetin dioxygenase-like cupin family protein